MEKKKTTSFLMMKMDSQQLAPHPQPREPGTADSFVFFGATGDLAYKQILPALQQMILRDNFNVSIIGVAKSGWTIDQLKARVRDSLTQHGGIDEKVLRQARSIAAIHRR